MSFLFGLIKSTASTLVVFFVAVAIYVLWFGGVSNTAPSEVAHQDLDQTKRAVTTPSPTEASPSASTKQHAVRPLPDEGETHEKRPIEYDQAEADRAVVFRQLTSRTEDCMRESALIQLRLGNRDGAQIAGFLVTTCGGVLTHFMQGTAQPPFSEQRAQAFVIAMAYDQLNKALAMSK